MSNSVHERLEEANRQHQRAVDLRTQDSAKRLAKIVKMSVADQFKHVSDPALTSDHKRHVRFLIDQSLQMLPAIASAQPKRKAATGSLIACVNSAFNGSMWIFTRPATLAVIAILSAWVYVGRSHTAMSISVPAGYRLTFNTEDGPIDYLWQKDGFLQITETGPHTGVARIWIPEKSYGVADVNW